MSDIYDTPGGINRAFDEREQESAFNRKKRETCPACHGQRTQYSQKLGMRDLCPACEGRGWIEKL